MSGGGIGSSVPGLRALLPRRGERLLPLVSAALLLLSFPPLHLLVPPFVALVPFALFVEDAAEGEAGAQAALRGGLLLGAASFGGLLHWIPVALWASTPWALILYGAAVAVLSALIAAVAWSLHRLRHGAGVPLALALPLAWTAGEWIRAHLPGGLAFPWLGLGASLTGVPELLGVAELVGPRGVTFWIAGASGGVAALVVRWREGRGGRWPAAAVVAWVLLPAVWGAWRAGALPLRPAARVAVVQTGGGGGPPAGSAASAARSRVVLDSLAASRRWEGLDLVVWPETVLPVVFRGQEGAEARRIARRTAGRAGAPVLVGAYGGEGGETEGSGSRRHNSAFLVDSLGPTGFSYHKRHLVPVVERGPGIPGGWGRGAEGWGGLRPGGEPELGTLADGTRFGVLVCYESAFPEAARSYRARGADVLVNMTNDAWFGGGRGIPTAGPWQHPAHLVLRAVETRTGVARAADGGISLFVDPVGRVHGRAPLGRPAVRMRTLRTTEVRTLYVRTGDLAGGLSVLAVFAFLGWGRRPP